MNKLLVRVLSALVGIGGLILLYLFLGERGLVLACVLTFLVFLLEYSKIVFGENSWARMIYFCFITVIYLTLVWWDQFFIPVVGLIGLAISILPMAFIKVEEDLAKTQHWQGQGLLGLFYCGILPSLAPKILLMPRGGAWFALVLTTAFGADTFAYFVGNFFRGPKLFPLVSPKKTISGAIGGLAGATGLGTSVGLILDLEITLPFLIGLTFCLGLLGELGDLFESHLKRVAQVKDSGHIMPGHGGVMDRLDSVYFALPLCYGWLSWHS